MQTTAASSPTFSNPNRSFVKVRVVIDGDTVEIEDGKKVRLIGIDTPETVDRRRPVGCYGKEASNFTKLQLTGKEVTLEKDISETDKYGRLLRYIWLGDTLFNETLVSEGYAQSSAYPPDVKYQNRFVAAQSEARNEKKGLWGGACASSLTVKPVIATPTLESNTQRDITSGGLCKYSCTDPDRDCADFSTQVEAQAFFNCCGFFVTNDPMRLDRGNGVENGMACESLP